MVNVNDGYTTYPLDNDGAGMNYGLELTAEQFMKKNYYYLFCGSVYEIKYKGSDGVLRDTSYNGNFALAFTAGKKITTGSGFCNRIIGLNIKTTRRGGFRDTPIHLEASEALPGQGEVYDDNNAYSIQYPSYFRTDIRASAKRNRPHFTQTLAFDIQNVSNNKNIYGRYYNSETKSLKKYSQTPFIPV